MEATQTTEPEQAEVNPEDPPPRDSLVRVTDPFTLIRSMTEGGMPTLHGVGMPYEEWAEIGPSRSEGHFMERFASGSLRKTINEGRDRIRCLFHHGQDPNIGVKPLGPITNIGEMGRGVEYDCELFDADYVRALVPGLEAGVFGSSVRFSTIQKADERKRVSNAKGLLERTIKEAALRELGPTPFPAYLGTTTGVRSMTDEFVLGRFPADQLVAEVSQRSEDRDLIAEMRELARVFAASDDTHEDAMRGIMSMLDQITTAHSTDAAPEGTSPKSAAAGNGNGLFGLDRDREVPAWHL